MSRNRHWILATIEPGAFSTERVWSLNDWKDRRISGLSDEEFTGKNAVQCDILQVRGNLALVEFPDKQVFTVPRHLISKMEDSE